MNKVKIIEGKIKLFKKVKGLKNAVIDSGAE